MSDFDDFERLLLNLGHCNGALSRPELQAKLADALSGGRLHHAYIVLLRDKLNDALRRAGVQS